ncbi:MAG: methionyl-tRNA formyltransferase [Chloracidobacterium sp.]|nr:methionyl-tRNA formyltransferase [Chloracidobacterium sp.]
MKIVFMGTPKAAVPSLEKILLDGHEVVAVYTQPDRPSGRGNKIVFSPVKEFAIEKGLAVFQPLKIKTPETLETFRSHNADLAVVVAYGRILPETYLSAYPNGAINVHFSLLPKYRGAAPVNWAIVNGEKNTGVTTMRMDEGLDTGDILQQNSTNIGNDETAVELMERLSISGAELLSGTLTNLATLTPVAQDESQATFAPLMKREDGQIDWRLSAREIADRIRGFQPFPSAFTHFQQLRLTLWRAHVYAMENEGHFAEGEVIKVDGQLVIGCGNGSSLLVEELQLEGKRRLPTRDFLNGVKLRKGEILGRASYGE